MSIREYHKDGKKFYRVYANVRSKEIRRIRLQKSKKGIESYAAAQREEKRLIKQLTEQVAKLEGKGLLWSEIIHRWEIAAKNDQIDRQLNRHTIIDHVKRLEKYTGPWLNRPAESLTRGDGRQILTKAKSKGVSNSHMKSIKSSINLVYNWALEEGLIRGSQQTLRSPVYGLGVGPKEEKIPPILTLEEVRILLKEARAQNHPWYPIWAFALSTGMRSGELLALEWSDIDETNGIIRVSKSFHKGMGQIKCPKNGTWRNVDINPKLAELISELRQIRGDEQFVLPWHSDWKSGNAGKVLRMFLKRIGIDKHVVFHTLRACFATHLLAQGVEPLKVMRMGGWSDLKTFQIYLRLSGVDVKGVAEALDVMPSSDMTDNVVSMFFR